MPAGRPTDYTPEFAEEICLLLAEGSSLRKIEEMEGMPSKTTILRWVFRHKEFRDQYVLACEARATAFGEEIIEISDDGSNDWMEKHCGGTTSWVENGEAIRRSVLRVETRKWLMSKFAFKRYGDKFTGEINNPAGAEAIRDMGERLAFALRKAAQEP